MRSFSALQRAEIAEIVLDDRQVHAASCFSALQRAEIAEIVRPVDTPGALLKVSVLFNEPKLLKSVIPRPRRGALKVSVLFNEPKLLKYVFEPASNIRFGVSVLFNEPKLLKSEYAKPDWASSRFGFSALQRAEIAEIRRGWQELRRRRQFQCSSTSRNC